MKKEEPASGTVPSPANDHGSSGGRGSPESRAQGGLDSGIRIIARAIGRQIAREHYAAWERTRRRQAANICRGQADVAILYKHFKFAGVTLAEGEISGLHVGLKGTMNALFLKDLAAKTHCGLRGRVEKGKASDGLCYGYDVVKRLNGDGEQVRGERKINAAEAGIVRRIFREFAAGKSPKTIATDLNRDDIPGPNGKAWGDTTIRGHVRRGTGVVNNELYAGVLVWNRLRYIKNPATGKRVSRVNPESEWIRTEVPDLRIVDEGLWQAARRQEEIPRQFENVTKGVRAYRARHVNELRRPAFLFSGLLKCGCCDGKGKMITIAVRNRAEK